jgi:hypothetical protein
LNHRRELFFCHSQRQLNFIAKGGIELNYQLAQKCKLLFALFRLPILKNLGNFSFYTI